MKSLNDGGSNQKTWLFGERLSCPIKSEIASNIKIKNYSKGESMFTKNSGDIWKKDYNKFYKEHFVQKNTVYDYNSARNFIIQRKIDIIKPRG